MKRILCLILIFNLIFMCACSKKTQQNQNDEGSKMVAENPEYGGEITLYAQNADTYNPLLTRVQTNLDVLKLVYDSLYVLDRTMKPVECLVRTASVDSTGLGWKFYLRDDVFFHNGRKLTSNDVIYSINLIKNNNSLYSTTLSCIESCNYIDDYTFEINLNSKQTNFKALLTFPVVQQSNNDAYSNFKPVGTGPYIFSINVVGKSLKLKRNDNWKFKQIPYIDTVNVVILNDIDSSVYSFEIDNSNILAVDYSNLSKTTVKKDSRKYQYATNVLNFLGFNNQLEIFKNTNVKKALAHLINKDELIEQTAYSCAVKAETPVNPSSYLFSGDFKTEYSVALAKELLSEDGFTDLTSDNILTNGKYYLSFKILVNSENAERVKMAEMIASMLKEGNISVSVDKVTFEQYITRINSGAYDMYVGEIKLSDDINLKPLVYVTEGYANLLNYTSPAATGIIDAIASVNEETVKLEYYKEFQKLFVTDMPMVCLYFKNNVVYYDNIIRGISNSQYGNTYGNLYEMFVK